MTEPNPALDVIRHVPFCAETPPAALTDAVTPADSVYVRSNFALPSTDANRHLQVGGAVQKAALMALEDLLSRPQRTVSVTMECAGNDRLTMRPLPLGEPWSQGAVSTAHWQGIPLRELLEPLGISERASEVLFTGADSGHRQDANGQVTFARSLPLHVAMHQDTILALAMNGAPLTMHHGAPMRLIVPDWYGMASVKWVTRIDVLEEPFTGYFQRQRYVYEAAHGVMPVTKTRVKSIITSPAFDASCDPLTIVKGWAWSGFGAIARVEVSVEGVEHWTDAHLGVPESPYAWTPWETSLELPHTGRVSLRSRATDSAGNVQPHQIEWNRLGYGNNAVRVHLVNVRAR